MSNRLEGKFGPDSDFDIDSRGQLIYWDCITNMHRLLDPAAPIKDENVVIAKVGQQNFLPTHAALKKRDLEETQLGNPDGLSIGTPIPPGLSTFLFFGSKESNQHKLTSITENHLARPVHPKNRLYISQVRDIIEAGWTAYYAPLIDGRYPIYNPLHVLIVPKSITTTGSFADATDKEKIALANTFVRWNC